MKKPYLSEDVAYLEADRLGECWYRHRDGDGCEPDLARLFFWSAFPDAGEELLELGCGDGFHTAILAERGLEVTGVDCSPAAIARARRILESRGLSASFVVGDACDPSGLGDGAFPAILDSHCLHCLVEPADREAFLAGCRRLLAPGGSLFLATMAAQPMGWTNELSGGAWKNEYARDERGLWVQTSLPPGAESRVPMRVWITEDLLRAEIDAAGYAVERFEVYSPPDDPGDRSFLAHLRPPRH